MTRPPLHARRSVAPTSRRSVHLLSHLLSHLIASMLVCMLVSAAAIGREDPRPVADAPDAVQAPAGRRMTRRAYRRGLRRHSPADMSPQESPQEKLPTSSTAVGWTGPQRPPPSSTPTPPRSSTAGIVVHRDQPSVHGKDCHPRQRFDLHLPEGCSGGGMPMVAWIHGDSWRDGSKSDCPIAWLAGEGYAVASVDYRPSDDAVFPAQFDDCREALAAIVRDAELWGIDPTRIAVVGTGAGGHLAALVGLAGQRGEPAATAPDAEADDPSCRVAAVCAIAAPTSLTTLGPEQDRPGSPASRLVGGPLPEFREAARRASPLTHVSADDPPVLLVHGSRDASVPVRQAVDLDKALESVGVDSTLVVLEDFGHSLPLEPGTPAAQALLLFLDRVLGPGIRPARTTAP